MISFRNKADNDFAEVDLNMDNITLTGLSKVKMEDVDHMVMVERRDNLEWRR